MVVVVCCFSCERSGEELPFDYVLLLKMLEGLSGGCSVW